MEETNIKLKLKMLMTFFIFIVPILLGCTQQQEEETTHEFDNQYFTVSKLKNSLEMAENWLTSNVNDDGYFNYLYDADDEEYSTKNNMIRQLMASRVLAEMASEDSSLEDLHGENLDYIFSHWYYENQNLGYIYFSSKSKLGAMAMMLRTLVYSPFYDNYKEEAGKLYNMMLFLQNSDGSFEPWYIEPSYEYDKDYLLTFYSGEAILSMVEYYLKTDNEEILNATLLSQDYYIDEYVINLTENYYPAYVPWHTQSLNKIFKATGEQKYADAIFVLNDKLLGIQNQNESSEYLGRFYNESTPEYGSPHSSSDAVYTEGLAYAYEIAEIVGDETHMKTYEEAIIFGVYNLLSLQIDGDDFDYSERVDGAIKYKVGDNRIRVDTTQHTLDAFNKIIEVFNL